MKSRAILLYWLLLLVPTLGAGLVMLRLLRHEGQRLALAESAALQNKARVMADEIALSVGEAREGLIETLRAVPTANLDLGDWARANPLIRNAFIWDAAQRRLLFPDEHNGLTGEQAGFIRRYADLFTARTPWPAPPAGEVQTPVVSARQQIRQLTKADYGQGARPIAPGATALPQPSAMPDSVGSSDHGWLPWYWQDELHLLGWLRSEDGHRIWGVEIEMAALLSRIAAAFAEKPANGLVYAILDGNGNVFAQRGETEIAAGMIPRAVASLSPELPHWQVAIYGSAPAATGRGFALVSALLVGAFLAATLSGGTLLLWQARRNLREAMQRTSFVSNVSHELKTPLTTIRMYAEMLAEGRVATEAKRRGYLEVITRESERLTRLVSNVLDFSRLEQGRKNYRVERLDVAAAALEVLNSQADRLQEAGLALTTEFPDAPAFARLDRDAFSQCVLNLTDNAIKYAPGGGKLRVRLRGGGSSGAAPDPNTGSAWMLEIEDAGPGVPVAHRARLFGQFHRVDDSLTAKVAGFGLGLSISRRLLRDQGGDLVYEEAVGGGAKFVMILPGA